MEKMARPLPINPTFLPPTHGVLKSLLENPLKLPFHHDEGTDCCFVLFFTVATVNSSLKLSAVVLSVRADCRVAVVLTGEAQQFVDEADLSGCTE